MGHGREPAVKYNNRDARGLMPSSSNSSGSNTGSSTSSSSGMWQATPQYQYNMPPHHHYNGVYDSQPYLYPQLQPQPATSDYSYYNQPPVRNPHHQQQQQHHQHQQQQQLHPQQYNHHQHQQQQNLQQHNHHQHQPRQQRNHHQHQQQQHYHHQHRQQQHHRRQHQQQQQHHHHQHQQHHAQLQQKTAPAPLPLPERIGSPSDGMEIVCASNPRASRNAAEKHRRDNLNNQIQAMASLVPIVACGGSRKRDKISVLRLGTYHLRFNYTLGPPSGKFLPSKYNEIDLEDRLIESLGGNSSFLLLLTTSGKIIYVSRHVEKHLGHEQTDLMGDSLFNYVYEEDKDDLRRYLSPDTASLPAIASGSDSLEDSSNSSSDDSATYQADYGQFRPQRRVFNIRMSLRANSRREAVHYEYIQLSGLLRLANERKMQEQANGGKPKKLGNPTSNDIIFVGTARLLQRKSVSELPYLVHNRDEYFTRHLIDGRIIFCDHRISIVAGYMAQEVSGTSAFKFMHKDDVRWTIVALRHMYDHGTPYGTSCYRLIAKPGYYIYLRTHGYLEIDEETKTVTSFICINTLTSEEEGEELIAEMKKRFSGTVNAARAIQGTDSGFDSDTECTSSMPMVHTVDDPEQLEQAINDLVSDLPATVKCDEPCPDSQYVKAIAYSQKLPPPSFHASQAGIKVDDIVFGKGGKGKGVGKGSGKGKQSPSTSTSTLADSPSEYSGRNGERVSAIGEKRIPELEDPSSPVAVNVSTHATAEKTFVSPNPSESESYSESVTIEDDQSTSATTSVDSSGVSVAYSLQNSIVGYIPDTQYVSNLQQVSLKRPYEGDDEQRASKKTATENCVALELVDMNDFANADIAFPAYIEVQSTSVGADLQEVPATFQQIDANSITLASAEGSFIQLQEFSDELEPSMQNNPEVIKLLTNLPQTITLEGTGEEVNICQYPTSDSRD